MKEKFRASSESGGDSELVGRVHLAGNGGRERRLQMLKLAAIARQDVHAGPIQAWSGQKM